MNNITGSQTPNNIARQQPAPTGQQPSAQQSSAFSSPNLPQQVTPLVQQLLQSSQESKSAEHHEHFVDQLNTVEDDFLSELNENTEAHSNEEQNGAGHGDGDQEQSVEDDESEEFNQPSLNVNMPVSVSGGGITVGLSQSPNVSQPIPDNRIIAIQSQNYSVAFLKRQVGNYANSSSANSIQETDGGISAQAAVNTPWGGASLGGAANQFEAFISKTFPDGDPSVPANAPAKYDGSALIVNGQVYGADLNNPKLIGSVDSFLIGNSPEHQSAVMQVLNTFDEIKVINSLTQADGNNSYMVNVPADHYGQWQAALMDNLPEGSTVKVPA